MALTKYEIAELQDLERLLTMTPGAAMFTLPYNVQIAQGANITPLVVEATRLWRETWVLPRIRAMIERGTKAQQKAERARIEREYNA